MKTRLPRSLPWRADNSRHHQKVIRVGTCSWTDPTLVKDGDFYPPEVKTPEQRLRFYSRQFPIVEIDTTYYHLPDVDSARAWAERTPEGFIFDVKAYALLTLHPAPTRSLPADLRAELPPDLSVKRNVYWRDVNEELGAEIWSRFRQALAPLQAAGKLGAVLLQFPAWVFPSHESREHIRAARNALAGIRCAIEFRHGSWLNDKNRQRTFDFLREEGLAYVCVDEPQGFKSSVPPVLEVTDPSLSIVRFHGHNAQAWQARGITASERFRYLYSSGELKDWAPRLNSLAERSSETHALMNNCYRDFAVRNAAELSRLLTANTLSS